MRAVARRNASPCKPARGRGKRIPIVGLVARGDGAHSLVEQCDLRLEGVAEQAGDAQGHVDARMIELGDGQNFECR